MARTDHVQGGRVGMTAVSSVWGNGDLGPLGVCVATGQLKASLINEINSAYAGHIYVFESGTESHFMTADTTILYLPQLIGPVLWTKTIFK